ncbi:MAG: hypothetical protein WB622_00780, partial [Acidobacteriaceae bacterium]
MMLRPVEFNAARDPGPGQADQSRLDHILAVEKIVPRDLVVSDVDAAANLGQDHQPQEFVLDMQGLPGFLLRLNGDSIDERKRIDSAAAPLVDPCFQKHRVRVGVCGGI